MVTDNFSTYLLNIEVSLWRIVDITPDIPKKDVRLLFCRVTNDISLCNDNILCMGSFHLVEWTIVLLEESNEYRRGYIPQRVPFVQHIFLSTKIAISHSVLAI